MHMQYIQGCIAIIIMMMYTLYDLFECIKENPLQVKTDDKR